MRHPWLAVITLACAGCSGGGGGGIDGALEPPACEADGKLRYVHDLGGTETSGEWPAGSYAFVNKLGEDPGYLEAGDLGGRDGTDRLYVAFDQLVARGASTEAQGFVRVGSLQAGNCESERASLFTALDDEGWTVQLVELHEPPYCGGPAFSGSFAACLVPAPI